MSFSIDFYSTDKTRAVAEILRLNAADLIPMEVAVFLAAGVRNLRTDTMNVARTTRATPSAASCFISFM